jgi:hypothetical protein
MGACKLRDLLVRKCGVLVSLCAVVFFTSNNFAPAAEDAAGREFFEAKIRPVLVERCYECHSAQAKRLKGGLRLDTRDAAREGGNTGPAVVPGKPDESLLLQAIAYTDDFAHMPPKGKLPDSVIADFRKWVVMGAPDPRDIEAISTASPAPQSLDWWSLRPVKRSTTPSLESEGMRWARTPIDAFIWTKLREKGLEAAPEADCRTLIRRLSFDLIGLPPTPDEVEAFLRDERPDAYERLVDRLLDSPLYGERWARHWMDAVHFAETHGHDQDRIRPNAWRYRDYLIESFNRDTPYGRFVQEQLAADVLFRDEPRLTVALGFIAAGPWDESSLRDIRDDSIDRQIGFYLDRDDMVTTTMATFVSSTVHCARCHDHKFDPIPQSDYYGLQAVFAGVDRADRAYDPDPETPRRRKLLLERRQALRNREPALMASLLEPPIQTEVDTWERAQKNAAPPVWTVLDPDRLESSGGATLSEEPDHSVFASGARPTEETTTVTAHTDLCGITAVRLEVLPDDRLPHRGPGRNDNGNLHLTEFQVSAATDGIRTAPIRFATADFDQAGWGVLAAIDDNPETAWGIYPEVGKPHQAVFELAEDVGRDGGTTLMFVLRQTRPAGHPIGRFRLSVTNSARPVHVSTIPDAIAAILAVPPESRSGPQKQELAAYYLADWLERQIAAVPRPEHVFAGAAEFAPDAGHKPPPGPRMVRVLHRGDIHHPESVATPGALACVSALESQFALRDPAPEGARRAALARWITDRQNPLTWRSIVNRVWQYHFGRGLVDTPNDFGRMGSTPSHPALLDWLATEFRDSGGSVKSLNRLIVTSAVYRQSTRVLSAAAEVDAENRLLWRQNRRRLDAESVHDAILLASGRLDRAMCGPSVQQFALSPGVHVTPVVDYSKYDWEHAGAGRRSVYRFLFRTLPDPFMDSLDAADASQLTPVRNESVTALQALALLNNTFMLKHAAHFANRLEATAGTTEERVRAAFSLSLGRQPSDDEIKEWSAYADKHGLDNLCRLLFNSNEFLFVD